MWRLSAIDKISGWQKGTKEAKDNTDHAAEKSFQSFFWSQSQALPKSQGSVGEGHRTECADSTGTDFYFVANASSIEGCVLSLAMHWHCWKMNKKAFSQCFYTQTERILGSEDWKGHRRIFSCTLQVTSLLLHITITFWHYSCTTKSIVTIFSSRLQHCTLFDLFIVIMIESHSNSD